MKYSSSAKRRPTATMPSFKCFTSSRADDPSSSSSSSSRLTLGSSRSQSACASGCMLVSPVLGPLLSSHRPLPEPSVGRGLEIVPRALDQAFVAGDGSPKLLLLGLPRSHLLGEAEGIHDGRAGGLLGSRFDVLAVDAEFEHSVDHRPIVLGLGRVGDIAAPT